MKFTVIGKPVPKGRPRLNRTRTGVYTPATTKQYEDMIAWAVRGKKIESDLWLHAAFHMPGKRRADVDNLLKSVLDGCQKGGLFENDSQVVSLTGNVYYDSDFPRTEFEAGIPDGHRVYCGPNMAEIVDGKCSRCDLPLPWVAT